MAICDIEGCEREELARGLCSKHYARWNKYGDPFYVKPRKVSMWKGAPPHKKIVDLNKSKMPAYTRVAEKRGKSLSQLIRDLLDAELEKEKKMNNEVTKFRVNIADMGKVLHVGDRVMLSDDGIDTTGSIVGIRRKDRDKNGHILSYFCKVKCANGDVKFATVTADHLIK